MESPSFEVFLFWKGDLHLTIEIFKERINEDIIFVGRFLNFFDEIIHSLGFLLKTNFFLKKYVNRF